MRFSTILLLCVAALITSACSGSRVTQPDHTATEQLLVTKAADEAVAKLELPLPRGTKVFLEAAGITGDYAGYVTALLREHILKQGGWVADAKENAEVIVEARSGALSVDEFQTLLGIPSSSVPIPLAGDLDTPEVAMYKRAERRGVAKIALNAYRREDGSLVGTTGNQFGFSTKKEWTVFFFFSWGRSDLIPKGVSPSTNTIERPW